MKLRTLYPLSSWVVGVLIVPLAVMAVGVALVATTDIGDLPFDNPGLWWLGGAVPLAGLLSVYGLSRRRRAVARFTSKTLAPLLASRLSPSRQLSRASLVTLALIMIVTAILGPRWGIYLQEQKVFGVDVVVALDVSRSMLAEDLAPNRLGRAKREIKQQLTERAVFRRANRLGLLAFAGSTSLRTPLTTDHPAFRSKLEMLGYGSAPRGGTALAQAIRAATDLFAKSPEEATKVILLVTDGEDHGGGAVEAATEAFEEGGIHVFTIGVGDPSRTVGARVPGGESGVQKPLLHDGQIVFSKLDVAGLKEIASAGGGQYAPIEDLHLLVDAIAGMWKTELTTEERKRHKPRYQWFLALGLVLLGLETLIAERGSVPADLPRRVWQQEASE